MGGDRSIEPKLRLFFGMFPDPAERRLAQAAAAALAVRGPARPVPPCNYHMTLAFVGEVPASAVGRLREIGNAQRMRDFSLQFDAYEHWPAAEVVVAAAQGYADGLEQLRRGLCHDLPSAARVLDGDRFRPHITLARKVAQAPVLTAMIPFKWRAREFSLVRSESSGASSAYTVVDTWPLLDSSAKS